MSTFPNTLSAMANTDIKITGVHPYAEKFPLLPEEDLADLADSISVNGLRLPIVVAPDGRILDGRNRWKACELAEVEPDTEVYEGDDLAEYVLDANVNRRNMSTGARAMATALVLEEAFGREDGRFKYGKLDFARLQNSTEATFRSQVSRCGVVLDVAPDLTGLVVAGEMTLSKAYTLACDARDAEERERAEAARLAGEEADAKKFIEESAPDLGSLVGGDIQNYVEALAIWEKRNREEAERIAKEKADQERDRRWGIKAAGEIEKELLGNVATVLGGVQLGAGIDMDSLIDVLQKAYVGAIVGGVRNGADIDMARVLDGLQIAVDEVKKAFDGR